MALVAARFASLEGSAASLLGEQVERHLATQELHRSVAKATTHRELERARVKVDGALEIVDVDVDE